MGNFKLEDYEPVEERIKRFYADHEDGRILTEMVNPNDKIETAVFKAYIYIDNTDIPKATGYAYEKNGAGFVNKTSHLENCETSAIGRALANYNYSGNKKPSREEMEKIKRGEKKTKETPDLAGQCVQYANELKPIVDSDYMDKYRTAYKKGNYTECRKMYFQVFPEAT